jgi:tetratricopeptide (TPR) repeat protein
MWEYTAELARQEIEQDPENEFAIFNLGVSLTYLGQETGDASYYQGGAMAFDQARTIGLPPRTLYYEHRPFMAYYKTGRMDDVLTLVEAMLATPGGRYVEEIFWYQGHALAATGDYVGAQAAYENALAVNPNFEQAQQSLDWLNATFFGG